MAYKSRYKAYLNYASDLKNKKMSKRKSILQKMQKLKMKTN